MFLVELKCRLTQVRSSILGEVGKNRSRLLLQGRQAKGYPGHEGDALAFNALTQQGRV